jgi:hypothetical protein
MGRGRKVESRKLNAETKNRGREEKRRKKRGEEEKWKVES